MTRSSRRKPLLGWGGLDQLIGGFSERGHTGGCRVVFQCECPPSGLGRSRPSGDACERFEDPGHRPVEGVALSGRASGVTQRKDEAVECSSVVAGSCFAEGERSLRAGGCPQSGLVAPRRWFRAASLTRAQPAPNACSLLSMQTRSSAQNRGHTGSIVGGSSTSSQCPPAMNSQCHPSIGPSSTSTCVPPETLSSDGGGYAVALAIEGPPSHQRNIRSPVSTAVSRARRKRQGIDRSGSIAVWPNALTAGVELAAKHFVDDVRVVKVGSRSRSRSRTILTDVPRPGIPPLGGRSGSGMLTVTLWLGPPDAARGALRHAEAIANGRAERRLIR